MAAERTPAPGDAGDVPPGPDAILGAKHALRELTSSSAEVRAAALFDAAGAQLASSDGRDWTGRAERLWAAADARGGPRAIQIHVGTELGEVFAVRGEAGSAVATAERFALASLMLSDLRALLRALRVCGEG